MFLKHLSSLAWVGKFWEKSPLRPDGDNHGIFHLLSFDKAEDFGSEVFPSIRPANASARDGSEAQMDAFDFR
jgi:hypothetical protein